MATSPRPALWAKLVGSVLALQVILLLGTAGGAGAVYLVSMDRSAHASHTYPGRPALELALNGFPSLDCRSVSAGSPPCAASRSTARLLGTQVRVVPGEAGEIVVEQDVRVRAAGPATAGGFLAAASVGGGATRGAVRLAAAGWNPWDPRLIQGSDTVTIRVPPNVRVLTPHGPPPSSGNPPNAPNAPNVPNTPNGRAGEPIQVPAGTTRTGDAAAWQADVSVDGDVTGDVSVVGGTARIAGTVHGSVKVWNGTAIVTGHVGRYVEVSGGSVTIGPEAAVAGAVTVWHPPAPVSIMGTVNGPVQVVTGGLELGESGRVGRSVTVWTPGSLVQIDGSVGGDVGVYEGEVEFGPRSKLGGRVRMWNGGSCAGAPCDGGG